MSRGHGELQRWVLAQLAAIACPPICEIGPGHGSHLGPWMSASELAEARCRHLHGPAAHAWPRSRWDWPRRITRAHVPWREQPEAGVRFRPGCTCPQAASLTGSVRRALGLLAADGAAVVERYPSDDGTGQLIASAKRAGSPT